MGSPHQVLSNKIHFPSALGKISLKQLSIKILTLVCQAFFAIFYYSTDRIIKYNIFYLTFGKREFTNERRFIKKFIIGMKDKSKYTFLTFDEIYDNVLYVVKPEFIPNSIQDCSNYSL